MTRIATWAGGSTRFLRSVALAAATLGATLMLAGPGAIAAAATKAHTGGTLVVGMTAAELPPVDTQLTSVQGAEGIRFVGNSIYDALTKWNSLDNSTKVPVVGPGLASSWSANANSTVWTFQLRSGVTFADGTPWNADAAIFNLRRDLDPSFQYYDAADAARAASSLSPVQSYEKTGPMTIQFDLKSPDGHFPLDIISIFFGSPTAIEREGNAGFAAHPVGTGPFVFQSEVPGQEMILTPNKHYWDGPPKLSKLILKPIPDPTARIAALRSGAVNWIEYPTPDDIAQLKAAGYHVYTNGYDHNWPWIFNMSQPPWNNLLVRQAANYAINRVAMSDDLLHGTAQPAYQLVAPANLAYRSSNNMYSYDPAKAKKLLAEAGYPHGFTATLSYPTSGSGNMIPGPMNEELQQDLAKVGIHVVLQPIEWSVMVTDYIVGDKIPGNASAINISLGLSNESWWQYLFTTGGSMNVGHYSDPKVDQLIDEAQSLSSTTQRYNLYAQAAKYITRDAPWLFVVHDRNPRALASSVHGFIQPKSWYVDLTRVWVSGGA